METITMDSTEMKLLVEALQEAKTPLEEEAVEVPGEEEITWTLLNREEDPPGVVEGADRRGFDWVTPSPAWTIFKWIATLDS